MAANDQRRPPSFEDTDPWDRPESQASRSAKALDPYSAPQLAGNAHPTVYLADHLLVSTLVDVERALELLIRAADTFGWGISEDPQFPRIELADEGEERELRRTRLPWATGRVGLARVIITAGEDARSRPPDAWSLLQTVRAMATADEQDLINAISLDHVVTTDPGGGKKPARIPRGNAITGERIPRGNDVEAGYGIDDDIGRRPVMYVGGVPDRGPDPQAGRRRPRVGVVDTGFWAGHPWFNDRVIDGADLLIGQTIGDTDSSTAPDLVGDVSGPLDGSLDSASGHGTFICGIVAQTCPEASIYAWRIMESDGTVPESTMLKALVQIAMLLQLGDAGKGLDLDVLNLSFGYYHETPDELTDSGAGSPRFDPTFYELLAKIGRTGTVIVCSAGNDATGRPLFPAAFAELADGTNPFIQLDPGATPILAVAALNPNGTDSMYSNEGPWVRFRRPGTNVLSSMPPFLTAGGLQPLARVVTRSGRVRETVDPDDFKGCYGLWSGTSFASPMLAGQLAHEIAVRSRGSEARSGQGQAVRVRQAIDSLDRE